MRIVLYKTEIAGNFGAVLRTAACFSTPVTAIEPLGFPLDAKALRRAAMDYGKATELARHPDWDAYATTPARRILFTTRATTTLPDFAFCPDDHLVFGNEGHGAPDAVHAACDHSVRIPIAGRSLNLSNSVAIALFEALRQTDGFASAPI